MTKCGQEAIYDPADYKHAEDWAKYASGLSCERCGGDLVCRCGQELPSHNWPCTHGGCLFECPKCDSTHGEGQRDKGESNA